MKMKSTLRQLVSGCLAATVLVAAVSPAEAASVFKYRVPAHSPGIAVSGGSSGGG